MYAYLVNLLKLLKFQQLTQFGKQKFLKIEDYSQCRKQFTYFLDIAKFDAEELLVPWIDDIVTEGLTQAVFYCLIKMQQFLHTGQALITQAITDEWHLLPSALEAEWLFNEIDNITQESENLAVFLDKLEKST